MTEQKKYSIIYADPPWSYKNKKTGRTNASQPQGSGAETKYPTMSTDDIAHLNVREISNKNSVCFLWVTTPLIEDGFRVLSAWGYKYKTMITWRKIMGLGMGYWFRGQTEHILVGVRGSVRAFRCQRANFLQVKVLRHSEKPEEFRALIEAATNGTEPRIELFARKRTKGWDVWGNEVESDVELKASAGK